MSFMWDKLYTPIFLFNLLLLDKYILTILNGFLDGKGFKGDYFEFNVHAMLPSQQCTSTRQDTNNLEMVISLRPIKSGYFS